MKISFEFCSEDSLVVFPVALAHNPVVSSASFNLLFYTLTHFLQGVYTEVDFYSLACVIHLRLFLIIPQGHFDSMALSRVGLWDSL